MSDNLSADQSIFKQNWLPESEIIPFLIQGKPLLDVRSEIEFLENHIPASTNIPILEDKERSLVGTCYKQQGRESAIQLGHKLVSGKIKEERIAKWLLFLKQNPEAIITCFRGGLRSQIVQTWCQEHGKNVPRIKGGTKKLRQILIQSLHDNSKYVTENSIVLTGTTGSGKTRFIEKFNQSSINLELLAKHRGSAFGELHQNKTTIGMRQQPHQAVFENAIAIRILQIKENCKNKFLIEDESKHIGKCEVPTVFFNAYRASGVIFCDENLSSRVNNILHEYVYLPLSLTCSDEEIVAVFSKLSRQALQLQKKLGGLRTQDILQSIHEAQTSYLKNQDLEPNRVWIQKLLEWYYDPIYLKNIDKRRPQILFRGNQLEVYEYLKEIL